MMAQQQVQKAKPKKQEKEEPRQSYRDKEIERAKAAARRKKSS